MQGIGEQVWLVSSTVDESGRAVAALGKFCIVHPHLRLEAVVLAFKLTQSCLGKIWKSNLDLSSNNPVFHFFSELEKNEKSR